MFQSFNNPSQKSSVQKRIVDLRKLFNIHQIDGYFVPRSDEYGNEYLPECNERLKFISGFTGSWGLAFVLKESASLFIDSRYVIQAPTETDTEIFTCICTADTPLKTFFEHKNYQNLTIGYDASLHTQSEIKRLTDYLPHCILKPLDVNLIDILYQDTHIAFPNTEVIVHPIEFSGKNSIEKIAEVCQTLHDNHADSAIITLPESLCWLLNVRASDVPHTPYVLSYSILHKTGELDWFVGKDRITKTIKNHLSNSVTLYNREDFYPKIQELSGIILNDNENSPAKVYQKLQENSKITKILNKPDPCLLPKAIKNTAEIIATTNAHIRDGVAVTRFACWLMQKFNTTITEIATITEIDCVKQLEHFRRDTGLLRDISFDTISGTGANGAIVHYRVSEQSNQTLKAGDLFLLDSGGQYLDGTTDITRTFAIGTPTDEMRTRYTQVLRGHIAISMAKFPEKTTGAALDSLARMPLWQAGVDFGHGTGHGVGLYLCVHEGPQSISSRSTVELKAGMILSNEPGYYKHGAFGIRIENLEVITPPTPIAGGDKPMLGFKTLTMVAYDKNLIDTSLLNTAEINHINQYHARILKTLMPLMTCDAERDFLSVSCTAL
jgi:Xaa-Pro aminopeptidase